MEAPWLGAVGEILGGASLDHLLAEADKRGAKTGRVGFRVGGWSAQNASLDSSSTSLAHATMLSVPCSLDPSISCSCWLASDESRGNKVLAVCLSVLGGGNSGYLTLLGLPLAEGFREVAVVWWTDDAISRK